MPCPALACLLREPFAKQKLELLELLLVGACGGEVGTSSPSQTPISTTSIEQSIPCYADYSPNVRDIAYLMGVSATTQNGSVDLIFGTVASPPTVGHTVEPCMYLGYTSRSVIHLAHVY